MSLVSSILVFVSLMASSLEKAACLQIFFTRTFRSYFVIACIAVFPTTIKIIEMAKTQKCLEVF